MQMQGTTTNQPNKISDFDLMTELDACFKHGAMQLTRGILECSNPQLRQQMHQSLTTCLNHQQQLSQLMMQKGYYKPLPASPEAFQIAKDQIATASAQVGGAYTTGVATPTVGTGAVPFTPPRV